MFKYSNLLCLLLLSSLGCGGYESLKMPTPAPTASQVAPAVPVATPSPSSTATAPTMQTYSGNGWTMQAPSNFIKQDANLDLKLMDSENKVVATVVLEDFDGPFGAYEVNALNDLSSAGFSAVDVKNVSWNSSDAVYMELVKHKLKVYVWSAQVDKKVYNFACGGLIPSPDPEVLTRTCTSLANSFKVVPPAPAPSSSTTTP